MSPNSISRLGAGIGAFLISVAHFSFFNPFEAPLLTDVRYYVYFAWQIAEGATPYLEMFMVKTPLSAFAGALFYKLGSWIGVDPLIAIRMGYLVLAASGGWLAFEVTRAIGGGRPAAGYLGLLAYCSFSALGELPAMGVIPKLLMSLGAAATGLLCMRGQFVTAGVAGALAFLDWQLGIIVWFGAVAAATLYGKPRWQAVLRVLLGAALGLAPFVIFFALRGALAALFEQTLFAALFRGAESVKSQTLLKQFEHVDQVVTRAAGDQEWLLLASAAGTVIALGWLWTRRHTTAAPLLLALTVYHLGIVGFSAVDFQRRGDAFAFLHSAVFFLGIFWIAIYEKVDAFAESRLPETGRRAAVGLLLVLALAAARPGPLSPDHDWIENVTLSEQQGVAEKIGALIGDRRLAAVEMTEILVLLGRRNPLPIVYWNAATWHQFRVSDDEGPRTALRRMLNAADADAWIVSVQPGSKPPKRTRHYGLRLKSMKAGWTAVDVASDEGNYTVRVYLR